MMREVSAPRLWPILLVVLLTGTGRLLPAAPPWWSSRGVLETNSAPADYAPAVQGQLKTLAANAYLELQANLPGGAGATVSNLVWGLSNSNNCLAVNLGQLKAVAAPFYDRLIGEHFAGAYPWTSATNDDRDYALASIGQLKFLFDFDVTTDSDSDGLPDGWENYWFGSITNQHGAGDYDGDGLTNLQEFQLRTDPIATWNSLLPFATGFEQTDSHSLGALNGQRGWIATSGAWVQNVRVNTGGQAVELAGGGETMLHSVASTDTVVIAEASLYWGTTSATPPTNLAFTASALVSFNPAQGIMAFNGNGSGGGTWTPAANTLLTGQWVTIKVEQNYTAKTWKLYVNNALKLNGLGFKDSAVGQATGLHVRSGIGESLNCDDVTIKRQ